MEYYVKSVVPIIESNYDNFTIVEKTIADFFIQDRENMVFGISISGEKEDVLFLLNEAHRKGAKTGKEGIRYRRVIE